MLKDMYASIIRLGDGFQFFILGKTPILKLPEGFKAIFFLHSKFEVESIMSDPKVTGYNSNSKIIERLEQIHD